MKTVRFWFAIALAALCNAGSGRAQDHGIAKLGRPPRLEIQGAQAFKVEEIRDRLLGDLDVANACYPTTSVDDLCALLTAKTREAYLYAGFADVAIQTTASTNDEQLEMSIAEGQKYLAGEVVVRGANSVDAAALIQELIAAPSQADAASKKRRTRWEAGDVARSDARTVSRLRNEIEKILLERGRTGVQFNVEIVPDPNLSVAALVISFSDEGTDAILDEILVSGNEKNSHDEVLAFLGLQPGMACRGDLETDVWRKLWESGRFTKSTVKLAKPSKANEPLTLVIDLVEYENAPPLRQELSLEEAALVNFGCWLNRFGEDHDEVVMKIEDEGDIFEVVLAPRHGVIATLRVAQDKNSPVPFTLAFVMGDDRIGFYSIPAKRKIEGIPTPGRVLGNVDITIHDGPPKSTGEGRLAFGVGLNSRGKERGLWRIHFRDTPTSMLSLAHEYQSKLAWDADKLTVSFHKKQLSLDAATGGLVEFIADGATSFRRTTGEFEGRLKKIDEATTDYSTDDSSGPLAAALRLYCDTGLAYVTKKEDAEGRKFVKLLNKMATLGILEPVDRIVLAACGGPDEEFHIPDERAGTPYRKYNGEMDAPAVKYDVARLGIELCDLLALPGTWPWDTWREAMFALAGKSRHLEQELVKHLSARDSGPVRHLIVGELLRANDMLAMARVFGLAGEARLSAAGFRDDYSALLDGETFLGHCLLTWADVIRHLDEAEVQTLCEVLVEDGWIEGSDAAIFADLARRLRRDRASPVAQALSRALDAWWQVGLREYVKKELRDLATAPHPTATGSQLIAADNQWRYRWHQGRWWYYGQNGSWQYWTGNAWATWPATMSGRTPTRR